MSYDIRFGVIVKDWEEYVEIDSPEIDDPTYNLGEMFRKCTGWDFEQGKWYSCKEVLPLILEGQRELIINKDKYKKYEPGNKWGDTTLAWQTLCSIEDKLKELTNSIPIQYLWIKW